MKFKREITPRLKMFTWKVWNPTWVNIFFSFFFFWLEEIVNSYHMCIIIYVKEFLLTIYILGTNILHYITVHKIFIIFES